MGQATTTGMPAASAITGPPPGSEPPETDCSHPVVPAWFRVRLGKAIKLSGDLPPAWARSRDIPKIVCWQGSGFRDGFRDKGGKYHTWRGLFSMTIEEMQTMAGPWMTANRYALRLSPTCFSQGCARTGPRSRIVQQLIAGLRWIWLNHGNPSMAWRNIQRTGRFNSYPRPGTNDRVASDPFRRCPVDGPISYRDGFGDPRHVGGYHPHWGIDISAPPGRPIRAPFDGLAVAHGDSWFAGRWVTVLGANGYVRNDHLSRFGKLGFVKAGTIIGYVGATGDARGPHDHFEWHAWVPPPKLHRAPSGYSRVMDAIDPYPFLNRAC
jgi:hypothetical protein